MSQPTIKRITCEHLAELEKAQDGQKEHLVIDIRDLTDFETGHIEGSVHVPKRELTDNLHTLVPDQVKNKRVIVILGPTDESEIEAVHERLEEAGFKNVEYLAGGIDRYCEIADISLDDIDIEPEGTPAGHEDHDEEIDPEGHDNEPLY
jgi:rhodanese-related sulfurtransferase